MKLPVIPLLFCVSVLGGPVYAEDAHHTEADKPSAGTQAKPPAKLAAKPQAAKPAPMGGAMMDNMRSMQAQMEKMRKTTDPKERDKLMQEHMKSMQDGMAKMHGMMGGAAAKGSDEAQQHAMMEQRMDMMQMMMEQMLEHQKATPGTAK